MVLADGIVVRENTGVGGSRGLYASQAIRAGDMVWREEPEAEPQFTSTPRTLAWVQALPAEAQAAYRHFMCVFACGRPSTRSEERRQLTLDALLSGTRPARTSTRACRSSTTCRSTNTCTPSRRTRPCEASVSQRLTHSAHSFDTLLLTCGLAAVTCRYMNHSCEPTCWFEGNFLMTATRDIAPGDEVRVPGALAPPLPGGRLTPGSPPSADNVRLLHQQRLAPGLGVRLRQRQLSGPDQWGGVAGRRHPGQVQGPLPAPHPGPHCSDDRLMTNDTVAFTTHPSPPRARVSARTGQWHRYHRTAGAWRRPPGHAGAAEFGG